MSISPLQKSYDVVVAGARCAGAATGMLLARSGLRVLVVDPTARGSDTLSTHALMRGAVLQLRRWGLLDALRALGTPPIHVTTFHYGAEPIRVPIKERNGVDALYAPRRSVLDRLLGDAAQEAGAEVVHHLSVVDLLRDGDGRVRGAVVAGPDGERRAVGAEVVVGADGMRSRVARLVEAPVEQAGPHATASIYGYWPDLENDGFHWYYGEGVAVGAIPTNEGMTCLFASVPPQRFFEERRGGLDVLHAKVLARAAPDLAEATAAAPPVALRAFPGAPGFLKRSHGPGWALVGDAGYFRDPITAHGITDALRDAELLSRAILRGGDHALAEYQAQRDRIVRGLMEVTDRIAAFGWEPSALKQDHLALSREMNAEVDALLAIAARPPALRRRRAPSVA